MTNTRKHLTLGLLALLSFAGVLISVSTAPAQADGNALYGCGYEHINFVGDAICVSLMPHTDGVYGFARLDSTGGRGNWNDRISSIYTCNASPHTGYLAFTTDINHGGWPFGAAYGRSRAIAPNYCEYFGDLRWQGWNDIASSYAVSFVDLNTGP